MVMQSSPLATGNYKITPLIHCISMLSVSTQLQCGFSHTLNAEDNGLSKSLSPWFPKLLYFSLYISKIAIVPRIGLQVLGDCNSFQRDILYSQHPSSPFF